MDKGENVNLEFTDNEIKEIDNIKAKEKIKENEKIQKHFNQESYSEDVSKPIFKVLKIKKQDKFSFIKNWN